MGASGRDRMEARGFAAFPPRAESKEKGTNRQACFRVFANTMRAKGTVKSTANNAATH